MNRDDSERMAIKAIVREVWSESRHEKQEMTFHEFKPFFLRFHEAFVDSLTEEDDAGTAGGGSGGGINGIDYSLWAKG